jgi:hypothetical protein
MSPGEQTLIFTLIYHVTAIKNKLSPIYVMTMEEKCNKKQHFMFVHGKTAPHSIYCAIFLCAFSTGNGNIKSTQQIREKTNNFRLLSEAKYI